MLVNSIEFAVITTSLNITSIYDKFPTKEFENEFKNNNKTKI